MSHLWRKTSSWVAWILFAAFGTWNTLWSIHAATTNSNLKMMRWGLGKAIAAAPWTKGDFEVPPLSPQWWMQLVAGVASLFLAGLLLWIMIKAPVKSAALSDEEFRAARRLGVGGFIGMVVGGFIGAYVSWLLTLNLHEDWRGFSVLVGIFAGGCIFALLGKRVSERKSPRT